MTKVADVSDRWVATVAAERPRLVRLCASLTRDPGVAEDLAQETLLEAWRHIHQLHDPDGMSRWLAAIARNVALRWRRRYGRERAHEAPFEQYTDPGGLDASVDLADDLDVDVEPERDELATLLDRALALLPPDTRQALIERYVRESPLAEVAARLGHSEAATAKQLQRGKIAFRRVLATHLQNDAAAYGLITVTPDAWQATRIWCTSCGQERLLGRFIQDHTRLQLRCPTCCQTSNAFEANTRMPVLFEDARSFKPAYSRLLDWAGAHAWIGLEGQPPACVRCGWATRIEVRHLERETPIWWASPDVTLRCGTCGWRWYSTLSGQTLTSPVGRRFWREHPRMRAVPMREIETAGAPALVTGFEDMTGQARLEIVFTRDTLEMLSVHGGVPSYQRP